MNIGDAQTSIMVINAESLKVRMNCWKIWTVKIKKPNPKTKYGEVSDVNEVTGDIMKKGEWSIKKISQRRTASESNK